MAIIHVIGSSIFFYVLILFIIFPIAISLSESEALLNLKKSFANSTSLQSWRPGTEPCAKDTHWVGVICVNGAVSSLRLRNLGLSGKIDVDSLLSLSALRSVGFVSNSFSGPIPDFHRMGLLKGLYLSKNQFSGEIPSNYFKAMGGLKKVWLSGNRFSGPIPSSLSQLSHLVELHLEDNQFSGTIPPFPQPGLLLVNLSNNNLEGEIPTRLMRFSTYAFDGNPELCGGNLTKACHSPPPGPAISISANRHLLTWFLVASTLIFLLMLVGIFVLKQRQERLDQLADGSPSISISSVRRNELVGSKDEFGSEHRVGSSLKGSRKFGRGVDIVMVNDEKGEFTLSDLMKAAAEVLGNGVLGSSYKAIMLNGLTVVVKRIKEVTKISKDEFDSEMRRLGSLSHKNVLTPLAYHYRKDEKLLVYAYQPQGSLLFLLHGDHSEPHTELNWASRLKIIEGIARGLAYLHTELSSIDLPHGNLKSSNVLLSEENEPLLTDYGLCSIVSSSKAAQSLTAYRTPEALLDHHISPKCDVYFLGVVILEILTGKFPSQYLINGGEGGIDIVQWVRSAIGEGRENELFDPSIERSRKCVDEMVQILRIGVSCTENNPVQRLDIAEVVRRIESISVEDRFQDMETIHLHLSDEDESIQEIP